MAVCLWRRAWYGVIIASLPVIVYGVLYHAVFGHLPDDGFPLNPLLILAGHVPHVPHPAPWRITHWFSYPKLLVLGADLPLAALALYGIPRLIATPVRLAVLAWYGTYAAVHVALYRLGIEGWAEDRYLLPLAPVVAIAGAVGLEIMAGRIRTWITCRRRFGVSSARLSKLILALTITAAVVSGLFVSPTPADPAEDAARAALAWLRQERLTDAPILSASSVWFLYLLPPRYGPAGTKATPLSDWPRGSIVVWDNEYLDDWGVSWAVLSSDHKWKILKTFEVGNDRVVVFQKELS